MTSKECETCLFVGMCKAANLEYCGGDCYVEGMDASSVEIIDRCGCGSDCDHGDFRNE